MINGPNGLGGNPPPLVQNGQPVQGHWLGRTVRHIVNGAYAWVRNIFAAIVEIFRRIFAYFHPGHPNPVVPPQPIQNPNPPPPQMKLEHNLERYIGKLDDPKLLSELAHVVPLIPLENTGMTDLLQRYTFGSAEMLKKDQDQLNQLLQQLVALAAVDENARLALIRPNAYVNGVPDAIKGGYPQNTPLCLLVKMGNLEGVQAILLAYKKEDLLLTTPRGNSALHLAVATGQLQMALTLMKRAAQLNIIDGLVNLKNSKGVTADQIFSAINEKKNLFKSLLDFVDPLFGGEEINKALVGRDIRVYHARLGFTPYKAYPLKNVSLMELYTKVKP